MLRALKDGLAPLASSLRARPPLENANKETRPYGRLCRFNPGQRGSGEAAQTVLQVCAARQGKTGSVLPLRGAGVGWGGQREESGDHGRFAGTQHPHVGSWRKA